MIEHLYAQHLVYVLAILEKLNEAEKAVPAGDLSGVYMEGPITLVLDGEKTRWRFRNDIGDEWCLEIGDES